MDRVIELLDEAIKAIKAIPDAGESVHLRWRIYQLLQAQKTDGDSAIYKELRCSIHLDLLGEKGPPVTLPCGHSYCTDCIAPIVNGTSWNQTCPDCRGIIPNGINLRPNVAIKAIVDRLLPR
jgi:hypothetical protein